MAPNRSIIKFLALAVTLVMITGLALPAVAQACMMIMEQPTAMNVCCPVSERESDQCHLIPAEDSGESPDHRHVDVVACCPTDDGVAFEEAVLNESENAFLTGLVGRAAWETEQSANPRAPLRFTLDSTIGSRGSGIGFHILYGAMLN